MAALIYAVAAAFTVTISVSAEYAAFATFLATLWSQALANFMLGKISQSLASRPADAISPDPELMAKYGSLVRASANALPGVTGEPRMELFEGFIPDSKTVEWFAGVGDCMAPDYPGDRTMYCVDFSLPIRSGDLVLVRYEPPAKYRGGQFVSREPQDLVKWAQQAGDQWVLHSVNDEAFILDATMEFRGRVTATMVMPEGMELGCAA